MFDNGRILQGKHIGIVKHVKVSPLRPAENLISAANYRLATDASVGARR